MEQSEKKANRIGLCVHLYNSIDFDNYFNHMYCAIHWGKDYDIVLVGKGGTDTAEARNNVIAKAIEKECTHAFFLDGDHFIPVQTLEMLLESKDEAIVSGVVCKRGENLQQIGWEVRNKQYYEVTLPLDGRVYQTSICAFGCTIINLEKLQKLKKPYFRDTCEPRESDGLPTNVRSDVNLCLAFGEIGEKCWIDTRVLVGHDSVRFPVYPQSAPLIKKLIDTARETIKLREGQQGFYYYL